MIFNLIRKAFIACLICVFVSSCVSKKEVVYFQNAKDFETIVDTDTFNTRFKVSDIVTIFISTFDLEAVKPFNLFIEGGARNGQPQLIDYQVVGERISILEALALAGDLNIKAQRENLLVIRDFNGTKTYTRVDLTSKELFNSPVYYLTQNDVIYVEPNNSAVSSASGDTRIGTIISISSFLITTALIFVTRN